jgi:hypothetical protein
MNTEKLGAAETVLQSVLTYTDHMYHNRPRAREFESPRPDVRCNMRCDYPGCCVDGILGFVKRNEDEPGKECILIRCEEHALETENIVRVAATSFGGSIARLSLVRIPLEEAAMIQVMRT